VTRRLTVVLGAFGAIGLVALVALLVLFRSRNAEVARDFGVQAAAIPGVDMVERATPAPLVLDDATDEAFEHVRIRVEEPLEPRESELAATTSAKRAIGRVLDLHGAPVAGVAVTPVANPGPKFQALTAADGSFDTAKPGAEDLEVVDPRWFTLCDTEPLPRAFGTEMLVIVAPSFAISGRVVDADGAAVGSATVRIELPWSVVAPFPIALDRAHGMRTARTESHADGSFELRTPDAALARLVAEKDGFVATSVAAPREQRSDLVLTLAKPGETTSLFVEGVVVHADGTPSTKGFVRFGGEACGLDEQGRFKMPIDVGNLEDHTLVAIERGYQAAVVPGFQAKVRASPGAIPFQRLVLGGPPLAIEGRVVDHEGRPMAGWIVQPLDPVVLVESTIPPESAESVAHDGVLATSTGADGAFRLDGLQERAYRLQAHSSTELASVESEPIAAGSRNVRLVVPADAFFETLEGVVVAADGTPIPGVEIRAALVVMRTSWGFTTEHSDPVTTDAEGRFAMKRVPRRNVSIDAGGDAILPVSRDLAEHPAGVPVRIVAARRCHARVENVPTDSGLRWLQVRGATGESLQLMQFRSGSWARSSQVEIAEGVSPLFAVSEAARMIVLSGDDVPEVSRPLALVPGQVTVVRW